MMAALPRNRPKPLCRLSIASAMFFLRQRASSLSSGVEASRRSLAILASEERLPKLRPRHNERSYSNN
jgi:hypothetical protein